MRIISTALLLLCLQTVAFSQKKPNILWITYEDTSPQFIGCYGNKDARTPVIDHLAQTGVRFSNAFSTGTVCSPSRTTLITGIRSYVSGTGNHRSAYPVPAFVHGFPYYMQKAGYYTSNNVKTDYNVRNEEAFTKDAWNESSNKAGWWGRKAGQPFFAVFNFMDSHQSRTMTTPYQTYLKQVINQLPPTDVIGDNAFEMPPIYNNTPEMRKQFARVYNAIKLTDNKIGELLKRLANDNLMDSTIIFCYSDHGEGIPRGKTNGINLGYRVPFVAWFPPMYKDLLPWKTAGMVTDELISFEDMAPTMLSLAGAEIPDYMKGRILTGSKRSKPVDHLVMASDRSDNGVDMIRSVTNGRYVYSRNYLPFMPEARYIRYMEIGDMKQLMRKDLAAGKLNDLQKSLFADRPAEFLFDIAHDVWETRNLVNDPKSQSILNTMRKQLDDELLSKRDIMLLPEYELGIISQNSTPFEYRLTDANFPIKTIYAAASLSGKRGKDMAMQQVKLLKSPNKIVRYWAALGLRSQSDTDLKPYQAAIASAMQDDYPPVAITASAIAYQVFGDQSAGEKLKAFCKNENPMLALMTINYLIYVKNKKPFVTVIQDVHDNNSSTYDVKAACLDFLGSLGLVPNTFAYEK
ncbi:MAG: sulfatase-like hydrolase/transferase [Bacteroidota bacterium]